MTYRCGPAVLRLSLAGLVLMSPAERPSSPVASVLRDVPAILDLYARGEFAAAVTALTSNRKISDLDREFRRGADAWIASAPAPSRRARLEVVSAVVVELMAVSFSRDRFEYEGTRNLLEWVCARLRRQPPTTAERWFHLSSIALIQGAGDDTLLSGRRYSARFRTAPDGSHVLHAGLRFPAESRFKLAYVTYLWPTQVIATWPLPSAYLLRGQERVRLEGETDSRDIATTLSSLAALFSDPAVGFEARLRSGVVRFMLADAGATDDLRLALGSKDAAIIVLARVMLGAVAESSGRLDDAVAEYRLAHTALSSSTSSVALAAALFRTGRPDEAEGVLQAYAQLPPRPDPWRLYSQRDYRFFDAYRKELRGAVQQ
jgi:hypothetical protein